MLAERNRRWTGMLTQGGQGGRPAPWGQFHRIPTRFPLNPHAIYWKLPIVGPLTGWEVSPQALDAGPAAALDKRLARGGGARVVCWVVLRSVLLDAGRDGRFFV